MYVTRREAYVDLSAIGAEGLHWTYVEQRIYAPWFYIELAGHNHEGSSRTMIQTMDPSVLATLTCSPSGDFSVVDVMLATPPHMNGTESWLMEKLLEFSQCHNEKYGSWDLYLVPGRSYCTPEMASGLKNFMQEKCIYYNSANK